METDILPNNFVKFKVTSFNEFQLQYEKGLENISSKANLNFSESIAFCLHNLSYHLKIYTFIRIALVVSFLAYCTLCALCFSWIEFENWQMKYQLFHSSLNQHRNKTTEKICEKLKIYNCDATIFTQEYEDYDKFLMKNLNFARFQDKSVQWTFQNSFGFVLAIFFTTGDIPVGPITDIGRILCCIFPILGIPLFLTVSLFYGKLLNHMFTWAYHKISMKENINNSTENSKNQMILTVLRPQTLRLSCNMKTFHSDSTVENETASSSAMSVSIKTHKGTSPKSNITTVNPSSGKQKSRPRPTGKSNAYNSKIKSNVPVFDKQQKIRSNQENCVLPIKIALVILYLYIAVGSVILHIRVGWDYVAAFYYLQLTFTTTGIGDLDPGNIGIGTVFHSVYIFFGFILAAMVLESISVYLTENFRSGLVKVSKYLNVKVLNDDTIMIPHVL